MEARTKALILILLLPGLLAEILSTNIPSYNFLNPFVLFVIVLVYGCGSLLIREAKVRWRMQWSIVFIAIAYGLFEEGLATQAFFNPYWFAPGVLSGNWMFFGVQWGWTILLLVFHGSISTLIPIFIVESLFPEIKEKPLVGKSGTTLAILGAVLAVAIGMSTFGGGGDRPLFLPDPLLLVGSFIAIVLLVALAYLFRKSRLLNGVGLLSPMKIALLAFFFQGANIIVPNILAGSGMGGEIGIALQLLIVLAFALFAASQLLHTKTENRHVVAYAFGSVLLWVFTSSLVGLSGRLDLLFASPVAFVLLVLWTHKTINKHQTTK